MSPICNELRREFQQKLFVCVLVCLSIIPTNLVSKHVDQLGIVSMAEAGSNAMINMTNPTLPQDVFDAEISWLMGTGRSKSTES
jgi:hypothetical protein